MSDEQRPATRTTSATGDPRRPRPGPHHRRRSPKRGSTERSPPTPRRSATSSSPSEIAADPEKHSIALDAARNPRSTPQPGPNRPYEDYAARSFPNHYQGETSMTITAHCAP